MPKRKMKDDLHFRFELQDSERDALQAWTISNSFNNVASGIGSLLMPFSDAFKTIVAAIIAKEGVDWLLNKSEEVATKLFKDEVEKYVDSYKEYRQSLLDRKKEVAQTAHNEGRELTEKEKEFINQRPLSLEEWTKSKAKEKVSIKNPIMEWFYWSKLS